MHVLTTTPRACICSPRRRAHAHAHHDAPPSSPQERHASLERFVKSRGAGGAAALHSRALKALHGDGRKERRAKDGGGTEALVTARGMLVVDESLIEAASWVQSLYFSPFSLRLRLGPLELCRGGAGAVVSTCMRRLGPLELCRIRRVVEASMAEAAAEALLRDEIPHHDGAEHGGAVVSADRGGGGKEGGGGGGGIKLEGAKLEGAAAEGGRADGGGAEGVCSSASEAKRSKKERQLQRKRDEKARASQRPMDCTGTSAEQAASPLTSIAPLIEKLIEELIDDAVRLSNMRRRSDDR